MADAAKNRSIIIDRIRKCLALAKSANEHEAASALAKARSLMQEYGVSEQDTVFDHGMARGNGCARPPVWEVILAEAVTTALPSVHFVGADGWNFVGRAPYGELAAYAFRVLHRQLKRSRADYIHRRLKRCNASRKRSRADIFCEGWSVAVHVKVRGLGPKPLPDEALSKWLEKKFQLAPLSARKPAPAGGGPVLRDFDAGFLSGELADLNKPISSTCEQQALLT